MWGANAGESAHGTVLGGEGRAGQGRAARFAGYHAFNQKKAAMGEMRALLGRLEALKCESCI